MRRKIPVTVLLLVLVIAECVSQSVNSYFENYNFDNGLSSNEVECLAQDEDGFLWIGTSSGLNRYDGNSFLQYFKSDSGLAENNINDIVCLPHHRIAIATVNGLNFFDTHTNTFSLFRNHDTSALAPFVNYFQRLCVDQEGNLWAVSQTDLYVFNPAMQLSHIYHSGLTAKDINRQQISFIWHISSLPDGNVLIHYSDHYGVYNLRTSQSSELTKESQSPWAIIAQPDFSNIYVADKYKRFWFFKALKDSMYEFDVTRNAIRSFPLFPGVHNYFGFTSAIYCLDSNHILFQLPDVGFYELSLRQNEAEVLHLNNLPATSLPTCFETDHQNLPEARPGNFWVGTSNGLYQWSSFKNQFKTVLLKTVAHTRQDIDVDFILPLNNEIWLCSYGDGFFSYNPANGKYTQYNLHLQATDIIPITWNIRHHRNDTLWVGTQQGLIWFVEKTKSFGRLPFAHPAVLDSFPITTQFEDSRGLIWMGIGVGHGLVCYHPEKNSFTVYNEKSIPEFPLRHPTAITEDENGNVWLGTQKGGGLVKWDRSLNQFTVFSAKQSAAFSDDRINDLYADHRGHIWIGTFVHGLVCYNMASGRSEVFGKEKGLSHETIFRMSAAQYPYLWMITSCGLDRFNMKTGIFEAFYKKDGLPADALSEGIFYDASSGVIYAGWKSGFIQFDALHFSVNEMSPKVFITDLLVNDHLLHADLSQPIDLRYKENDLAIDFTAADLVNGADLKFRYRLNKEENWKDLGKNRQIHFSNLPPGKYLLKMEAANKSGVWNEKPTTLNFFIQPPFWNTGWFYLLAALIVSAIVYGLYRFRIRQLQHVQEMRDRIAQDLHDDLGGTMTAINLTNELAMQHLQEPAVAKKLLMNMSEDLKNVGETLDDIVWEVNPKNDSMTEVMARMRRYASHTWETAGIDFTIQFEKVAETVHLNMVQRHDLYLTFKEAVNNVAKHSECRHASLSVLLQDHTLLIEAKDDGKGFDVNLPTQRNGLKNMQSRMRKWNGEFEIQSVTEKGTTIRLRMPITQKGD